MAPPVNDAKAKRRVQLAARQLTLASIARREAMAALADAVGEEARSSALASRSQELLREYGRKLSGSSGAALRGNASFVGRLQEIASQAEQAHKDAGDQAHWQAQTLAAAESRKTRFEERESSARREIETIREAREQAEEGSAPRSGMAHKLQGNTKATGNV